MPSQESETIKRHWQSVRKAWDEPQGPQPDNESWGNLTAEPREVDYLEIETAGVPAMWAIPKNSAADRVLLCLHGGGFVGGSIYSHRKLFGHLAKAAGVRALLLGYHLAPKHVFPSQVDEAVVGYRWLLEQGFSAGHIAFTGDSAGGGLAVTAQLRAREHGLPVPAATLPFSPWVDMEVGGKSYETNRPREPYFHKETVEMLAGVYLGPDGDLRDPHANPLHADLSGLGPMYIQVGGDEGLLDDARLLADHARRAGVDVRLDVFDDMLHTFQMGAGRVPEADDAIRRMADWVRSKLDLTDDRDRAGSGS